MSGLQREILKTKFSKFPAMQPPAPLPLLQLNDHAASVTRGQGENDFEDEEYDGFPSIDDSSSASSASSTSTIRPNHFPRPEAKSQSPKALLEPTPWQTHFSEHFLLPSKTSSATFSVYLTPPTNNGPLFVTHHGAGSSALSFAALASEIRRIIPSAGVLSPDARGHGQTSTANDEDLSLVTLTNDLVDIVNLTKKHCGWEKFPDILLVGHSLGGAVVVNVAKERQLGSAVQGYAVLDVVEGSAIDALQSMHTYLSTRPSGFTSVSQGIEWHLKSRTIRSPHSARVSVPALLRGKDPHDPDATSTKPLQWRTDLAKTQPYWEEWFVGLSRKFLESKGGKLLVLAGTDRLDKELMIGQMQGKYQLIVIPEVGHFVHEDSPEKVASALVEFYKRQAPLVLPPKVGQVQLPQKSG